MAKLPSLTDDRLGGRNELMGGRRRWEREREIQKGGGGQAKALPEINLVHNI